jgi:hypothetical protein
MHPLVIKPDLDQYKYVADSVKNSAVWPQFVSDAQLFDIKSWLGDGLFNEIITESSVVGETLSAENKILLDGGTYLYQDKTYIFQGLKACIIYYAFARFVNENSVNFTAFGIVVKDSDLSTPASDKRIQRLETENRLKGDAIRDETILYLNRNHTLYPLWTSACTRNYRRPTFQVIGD